MAIRKKKQVRRSRPFHNIIKQAPFKMADGHRVRLRGFTGTADSGTSTNIQFEIDETRFLNGVQIILDNHVFGDKAHFEVVDVDNILGYGTNVVLDRFGEDWNIAPDENNQGAIVLPYPAKVTAGLYIRIVYVSTGSTDVSVAANLYLHKQG
ncbi:MAG: hypothetical protein DRN81_02315 [Thermoproteota archaeon]|nr:MAG: hypothetical protein DRN81_02315 [Candidatus Korarchaeota archaeon]